MTAQLSGQDLTLFRGERCLFRGVEFALNPGEMLLLEGLNGSGKTSLMRAIAGLLEFETGEIRWNGVPTRDQRQAFHSSLVWMAHRVGFKADLTLTENLDFEASLRPCASADRDEVFQRLGLSRLKRLPLRSLSAGQQRRVALARMLLSAATLWLMDEPVTNLDRDGRRLVAELVQEHLVRGGMCIMAAHQEVQIDATVHKVLLQ
ncbi:MAG: cytochrome c biogenesis heme-transporting ATPase CcmA [Woeseiaceae bacterium]